MTAGNESWVLSKREIAELARTPIRARQVAFLRQNGIRHYIDGRGWPVVLRSAVEPVATQNPPAPEWVPNKARDISPRPRDVRPKPQVATDARKASELARRTFASGAKFKGHTPDDCT